MVDVLSANETMARMFCPMCGKKMVVKDGEVTCVRGGMGLSQRMHDGLSEVFIARTRRGRAHAFPSGGRWFCPGCGEPMKADNEHIRCETCGEYLDEFIHGLVELHPHRVANERPSVAVEMRSVTRQRRRT